MLLGRLNAAIGRSVKKSAFFRVKDWLIISKDTVKFLKGRVVGGDKWNVVVVVKIFVFFVSTHVIYLFCPEEETGLSENLTLSIVCIVSYF